MIQSHPGEEWRELKLDSSKRTKSYLLSNKGRIISFKTDKDKDGRLLKTHLIDGYPAFIYRRIVDKHGKPLGKTTTRFVHKMVAERFIGPPPTEDHRHVIHLDYDKQNNHVSNLQWATKEKVEEHLSKNPNYIRAKERQRNSPEKYTSKLTVTDVIRLKKKIFDPNRKTRYKIIAKQFGISEMQLYRIKTGENWSTVTVPEEEKQKQAK